MANPFFGALGGGQQMNPMQMLQQLKQNPMQFLMQRKFNIPKEINVSDPNAILNHLVSTGQVSQQAYNQARQTAQQMMGGQNTMQHGSQK